MTYRIGLTLVLGVLLTVPINGFAKAADEFKAMAPIVVRLESIEKNGLIVWTKNEQSGGRLAVQFPQIKLFDESGKLAWIGNPREFARQISSGGKLQAAALPVQVKTVDVKVERSILGLSASTQKSPVLVIYVTEPCPPCENLLAPVFEFADKSYGKSLKVIKVVGD